MIRRVTVFDYSARSCAPGPVLRVYTSEYSRVNGSCEGIGFREFACARYSEWTSHVHHWLDSLPKMPRGQKEVVSVAQCFFRERDRKVISYERAILERILRKRHDVELVDYWTYEKVLSEVMMDAEQFGRWEP